MARVLVTGGTGVLGRRLVPILVSRGHDVRVAARHAREMDGAQMVRADVRTGEGLDAAVAGIDTVVHAATSPRRGARKTEVLGTRNLLAATAGTRPHLVYVSIVGVDRNRFPYYEAKWEAEQLVESGPVPWTIQRATQFHDLLELFLSLPVFMETPNLAFQVVDAGDVALRLADLVDAGPSGRVEDLGGPEVRGVRDLAETRRTITGRRARLVRLPRLGPLRAFDAGFHLCPDHRSGRVGWDEWLRTTIPAEGQHQRDDG